MPIPRGFVEVHPLEDAPFILPVLLKQGAIVKFRRSRETTATDETQDSQIVNGFISRAGSGQMVHEFTTRGGIGLPFKLIGSPQLNARLCAIKPGWLIWLQCVSEWRWDVGAAYDLVKLRDLQVRMREVDDELDRAILEQAGAFSAGAHRVGITDAPDVHRARAPRARVAAPRVERQRARVLLRKLLAIGPRSLTDVRRDFRRDGLPVELIEAASEDVGAEVCTSTKGRGRRAALIRLPSQDDYPVRVVASDADAVRHAMGDEDDGRDEDGALLDNAEDRALEELLRERAVSG